MKLTEKLEHGLRETEELRTAAYPQRLAAWVRYIPVEPYLDMTVPVVSAMTTIM